ncbi:MAG TPA: MerR family DNA-binding transcriptional regulator [Jatrophihabitans sp.]
MRRESDIELMRVGKLSEHLDIPIHTLRRLADAGKIPSVRTDGGHRLFDPTAVRAALGTSERSGTFGVARIIPTEIPIWSKRFDLADGIEEHLVWQQINSVLGLDEGTPAGSTVRYAITEMLNNAIDHSRGTSAEVAVWSSPDALTFRISDDGEGAFAHLRRGLGLADDFEAISALTKGKQTTWKERHTGEGIFFTSKVLDVFRVSSNRKRWTVDNIRGDQAVGVSDVEVGTVVIGQIDPQTTRSTREVFSEYSQDFEFVRTRPVVKLFGLGLRFVSRSEARRLLTGLDEFTEIDVDFAGVEDVGQGFVDELLRVWPQDHPGIAINPINMNGAVEFMVRRGLAR